MIKKYTNMLLSGLVACTFAVMSVSAKDVTKTELIEEAKNIDSSLTSIYLIGSHVFTSHYDITLQNIIDASRSIDDNLPFDQLTIYLITPEGEVHSFFNNNTLEEQITISNINTVPLDEETVLEEVNTKAFMNTFAEFDAEGSYTLVVNKGIKVEKETLVNSIATNLIAQVKDAKYANVKEITIKYNGVTYTVSKDDSDEKITETVNAIVAYIGLTDEADSFKYAKDLTVEFVLDETKAKLSTDSNALYTIKFKVDSIPADTDKVVTDLIASANKATTVEGSSIKDAYRIDDVTKDAEGNNIVTVNILNRSLKVDNETIKGTTLAASIYNLLNNEDSQKAYESIKITVDGKEPVIIKKDTTTNDIKTSVMALFSDVSKLEDLRNKSIKVEYGLTVNAENSAKSPVYTFNFVVEVDPNTYFASIGISGYTELTCTGTADKQCDVIVNLLKPSSTLNETNAFSHLVNTIKNAFNVGTKSVTLNIGSKSKTTFEKTPEKEDINNVLSVAGIKNYNELANEENAISVTFVANTEEGYVFTRDNTQTYTFTIGEFVDTDKIVDKISEVNNKSNVGETFSEASEYNKYYHLSRNDNQLTFDVNLQASGKLYNFKPVVTGFATIIYGESEYSVIKKAENKISKIVIRDNNTKKEYELKTGDETGETLETILASMLGTTSISSNIVSPTMLSNLDFSIKFVIDSTKELIPGLDNYGDYTEGSQSATYDVSFKVNGFNVNDMIKNGFKNASYLTIEDEDVTADDNVYYLKVNLQNVGTSLEEADLFNKLRWYAGLFNNLTITVDETETSLNANDLDALKETIDELLKLDKTSTIEDLYKKTFTLKFELADDVNLSTFTDTEFKATADRKVGPYTINVTLTYDVEEVDNGASLTGVLSKNPEVIELAKDGTYGAALTINDSNKNIVINGNGATINGDVTVNADNVTFNDVNITGKLIINDSDSEKGITIKGNGNTNIKGAIKVQNSENVTIEGMNITGTNDGITLTSSKNAVITSTGEGTLTLKNSKVSYSGGNTIPEKGADLSQYVYSLVYLDGNAEITDTTFDITNVKNPIEYKYDANEATKIVIDHNTFTGRNYVKGDAHNVISFYGAAEGSVIEVTNNTFDYANWAVRISNNTSDSNVTYIITGNKVKDNNPGKDNNDRNPLALIGIQTSDENDDLKNITIVYDNNTAEGYITYETNKELYTQALESGKSALIYAYVSGGNKNYQSSNKPNLLTYEKYLEEQNKVQE